MKKFHKLNCCNIGILLCAMLEFGKLFKMTHSLTNACKQCFLQKKTVIYCTLLITFLHHLTRESNSLHHLICYFPVTL